MVIGKDPGWPRRTSYRLACEQGERQDPSPASTNLVAELRQSQAPAVYDRASFHTNKAAPFARSEPAAN
jgi:hypothetical protein